MAGKFDAILAALSLVLLVSGLAVIYSKYESRSIFIEIQEMEKKLDYFEVEWGRDQLELSMLAEENRIELTARNRLKLVMPVREKIIFLKP